MKRRRDWLRRLVHSRAVIALAWAFSATLSAQSQSKPGTPMPDCMPADRQPSLVGHSPGSNLDSQPEQPATAIGAAIQQIRGISFPELGHVDLRVRIFHSASDYFRTRFSVSRFLLLRRMRYFVDVNPALSQKQAPSDGVCAILAHELVHVVFLSRGNRIRRFGLVRLLSRRHTAKFERGTDLEAIHRGYGDGLKRYRVWVYAHIPPSKLPEKLHNYFSPEEIAAIQKKLQERPDLFPSLSRHVPMNLQEIQNGRR